MKKVLTTLTVVLLLGGLSFAQEATQDTSAAPPPATVKISAWGRGIYAPLITTDGPQGEGVGSAVGTSFGGAPRLGFTIAGDSQYVGFHLDLQADNAVVTGLQTGDTELWIKPFTGLEIEMGRAENDTLRGEADFGSWDWIRTGGVGDDFTFLGIGEPYTGGGGPLNAIVSYTNGGLFVFVEQEDPGSGTNDSAYSATNALFATPTPYNDTSGSGKAQGANSALANLSYGAGYTIDGVGQIRAQELGYASGANLQSADEGAVQAAFRLTGIKNLYVDIGVQIPTTFSSMSISNVSVYQFLIPFYANYTIDKAKIHLQAQYDSYSSSSTIGTSNAGLYGAVGFDYDFGDKVGFNSDVRWANQYSSQIGLGYVQDNGNGSPTVTGNGMTSVLLGVTKGFSNGLIGIGAQYSTTTFLGYAVGGGGNPNNGHFAIPVRVEYWF